MLLRYFYDTKLAHASYMVGCQATHEAIIIDPGRDLEPYLKEAEAQELCIVVRGAGIGRTNPGQTISLGRRG